MRTGKVYIRSQLAGWLRETDYGYEFEYADGWLKNPDNPAVSLTMPVRREPYKSRNLFPFFDGLIPEGWLLDRAVKNWKIAYEDRFGLLLKTCADPVGFVRIEEDL